MYIGKHVLLFLLPRSLGSSIGLWNLMSTWQGRSRIEYKLVYFIYDIAQGNVLFLNTSNGSFWKVKNTGTVNIVVTVIEHRVHVILLHLDGDTYLPVDFLYRRDSRVICKIWMASYCLQRYSASCTPFWCACKQYIPVNLASAPCYDQQP